MGVINYARPFVDRRGGGPFPKHLISGQPGFHEDIHQQLIDLRKKLIAHSDIEFAPGRVLLGMLNLKIDSTRVSVPTSATVMIRNLHTLGNFELAKAYLAHSEAARQAAADTIDRALEEYAKASVQYAESWLASSKPANVGGFGEFPLLAGREVKIPDVTLYPNQLLSFPPLKLGSDGYLYRGFAASVSFRGDASFKLSDGSDFAFSVYDKEDEPDSNEAPSGDEPPEAA
jgi:hypothetical protein